MTRVVTSEPDRVLAFTCDHDDCSILAVVNLFPDPVSLTIGRGPQRRTYNDLFSGETVEPHEGWAAERPALGVVALTH